MNSPAVVAREPVMTVAVVGALIGAAATILASFGIAIGDDKVSAVEGLWAIVGPIIAGLIARRYVSPVTPTRE